MLISVISICILTKTTCTSTLKELKHPVHYASEFFETSTKHRQSTISHPKRAARSLIIGPPFASFNIDTSTLSTTQQYSCGLAYRLFVMMYQSEATYTIDNITIVGSEDVISSDGGVIVGTANMNTRVITMYTSLLPDADTFMIVLIHEILHLVGFGTLASPTKSSFVARTNTLTLVHDSENIRGCVETHMNSPPDPILYVDRSIAHWNASNTTWENDIMLPMISMHSRMSMCTMKTVIDSRQWSDEICVSNSDCTQPKTCQSLGFHLIKVCQYQHVKQKHHDYHKIEKTLSQMVIFILLITVFFNTLLARELWKTRSSNRTSIFKFITKPL